MAAVVISGAVGADAKRSPSAEPFLGPTLTGTRASGTPPGSRSVDQLAGRRPPKMAWSSSFQ